jgi:WhiB family redox-sensing transcriptional regulator
MSLTWSRPDNLAPDTWRERAACRSVDPDLFFPVGVTGPSADYVRAAKAVCASCPVQEPCLDYAIETGQDAGIWGGTSEEERRVRRHGQVRRRSA